MPPPNRQTPFDLTPKAQFQSASPEWAQLHNNYSASDAAQASLAAALAEMAWRQQAADPVQRAHNASKLEGAREFIKIWLNVGRPTVPLPDTTIPALKPIG